MNKVSLKCTFADGKTEIAWELELDWAEGRKVGIPVGFFVWLGVAELGKFCAEVGLSVNTVVGEKVGIEDMGELTGRLDGWENGCLDGLEDGKVVGENDGCADGLQFGT
jgi:hypothetical protein